MSKTFNMAPQELATIESYWEWVGKERQEAAQAIVPLLGKGNVLRHKVLKSGDIALYIANRGAVADVTGSAEPIESGAGYFAGQVFEALDEPGVAVVGLRNHLVFPTGHIAPYEEDRLSVEQVGGGLIDFDNPCLDIKGTIQGSTHVLRLEAQPVLLDK